MDPSQNSLARATKGRAKRSDHGKARGAAGVRRSANNSQNSDFLTMPGQSIAVNPGENGFEQIAIGAAWDNVILEQGGFIQKLFKKVKRIGTDLDLGCLYELEDGGRGCIQAFGNKFGNYNSPPYIMHNGDEKTGDVIGYDEEIRINGKHWDTIRRVLIYVYIYDGAPNWAQINPQIMLDIPGEEDLVVTLNEHNDNLNLCAIGGIENENGGIKLTNYTEYFPGHAEMDRAFGFGLDWGDGTSRK